MAEYERHEYDVVVVGAGGAGLRAAIEASAQGARTALVCKSLLGKAHTVMAEGGIAAALGNVYPEDNWQVHFRDTMRGGKMLNNWRMAQLHAQEAPDRVHELERWGALFDRTNDGRILQRDFGGHRYARLAHVGDRTGLEMIRTLQQHAVHEGIDVFMECTITQLLKDGDRISGAVGYWRESGKLILFGAKAVVLATGGVGKAFKITSNSWEYTGDGHALAYWAGADLIDMECVQFHPTGMVWPPSVRGILVTEGVRGDGGTLKNSDGEQFMFNYITPYFAAETADNIEEAERWYEDKRNNRRTPNLLPRDEVARAINTEVKAGPRSPHGGVFLDIASRRSPEYIRRRLPSMYHQFKQLADVDITAVPMEVGPTIHYIMGGIRVDADSAASTVPGLFAAGDCAGGMHGANRLGGNSLSDLLVFGRRAGLGAAEYAKGLSSTPVVDTNQADEATNAMLGYFDRRDGENPYTIQKELQDTMHELVGIIRTKAELDQAVSKLAEYKERASRCGVEGHRQYNPGWHLAMDLRAMLTCSEAITRAAELRKESRGGHTREDFPDPDPEWAKVNVVVNRAPGGEMSLNPQPLPPMPPELATLFEEGALMANVTDARVSGQSGQAGEFREYTVDAEEGQVVLDVIHTIQATQASDLAVRWNCKAGKCGSCSAEVNGKPRLMCMTRMNLFEPGETITVSPMKTWPLIRDLVTDVSFNYKVAKTIPAFTPKAPEADGTYRMMQEDIDRGQEFRKCIECFLCQNVCHVIRDHEENKENFAGPRFFVRLAELDMHPLDTVDRLELARKDAGIGYCNITKCCTDVCPEDIHITDNAIIPLKERVADRYYDPIRWVGRKLFGK